MKMLVTGRTGQLGRELKRSLACLGEVVACDRQQLDLADPDALRSSVRAIAPDATSVDRAANHHASLRNPEPKRRGSERPSPATGNTCMSRPAKPGPA